MRYPLSLSLFTLQLSGIEDVPSFQFDVNAIATATSLPLVASRERDFQRERSHLEHLKNTRNSVYALATQPSGTLASNRNKFDIEYSEAWCCASPAYQVMDTPHCSTTPSLRWT